MQEMCVEIHAKYRSVGMMGEGGGIGCKKLLQSDVCVCVGGGGGK